MNRIRRVSILVATSVMLATGISCGDGGGGTTPTGTPGVATVSLVTPNPDDGAVIVTIKGEGLGAVTAASGSLVVFPRQVSTTEVRVIVVGNLAAAPLFNIAVGAVNRLSSYSGDVNEVASRDNLVRTSTGGYSLRLTNAAP